MCYNHVYFHSIMEYGIILGIRHLTEKKNFMFKNAPYPSKGFNIYTVQGNLYNIIMHHSA